MRAVYTSLLAGIVVCLAGCTGAGRRPTARSEALSPTDKSATAVGVVFHDRNQNGRRDFGERGLPGVRVSNGRAVVLTDERGAYRLPADDDTIIFVVKPRGWRAALNESNLPQFYYVHKPAGSPELKYAGVAPTGPLPAAIDFPLYPQHEPDRFNVVVLGDTQTRTVEEVEFLAHDVLEELRGTDAAFAMTLGDNVFDFLDLYEPLLGAIGQVGLPFRMVLGNHDENYDSPDDEHSDETFERLCGPSYYSFDYGPVHFIVLDDVIWVGATDEKKGNYHGGLSDRQLEFLRNDLRLVPREQLVVLAMHIPLVENEQRRELFELLAGYPRTVSFAAHWHTQQHLFLDRGHDWPARSPHHHVVFATACGSWWHGAPDELGIPHTMMPDGTPNGWSLVTFDGSDYSIEFKVARRPADYQMNIFTPESVVASATGETEVLVNVFAGSERSRVRMRVSGGRWVYLERVEREDPYFMAIKQAEQCEHPPRGRLLPRPSKCQHLWLGHLPPNLPPGTHLIEVETTDMFGHTYRARRMIRVE